MPNSNDFNSLPLHPALLNNLIDLGFKQMTPIQAAALPMVLSGRDVIGKAKTGSGKTVAFGLGVLHKLDVKRFRVQALIMCPTRELADQVAQETRKLARAIHNIKILTLCGGMPFGPQVGSLEHGAHIVVGTPGRIADHLRKGNLVLDDVSTLVLDEADRMLDMGFQETLDAIVTEVPQQRQTLLFSATYPTTIAQLAARVQTNPVTVEVAATHAQSSIEQHFYRVDDAARNTALRSILSYFAVESSVVFCNTKRETDEVADSLKQAGFTALALHGDMEQKDRDQTLVCFANKSASILVATDVAARGLDIAELDMVVNYHVARDTEVHLHRIGRTGRAGLQGLAISLVGDKELHKLEPLSQLLNQTLSTEALPSATNNQLPQKPKMVTLQIDGGKKQKLRPGDIVGALTGNGGIDGDEVGKINVLANCAYVAVNREVARRALQKLKQDKLKGRAFRVRVVGV